MSSDDEDVKVLPFHEMGLDDRILKAIAKLGWCRPTMIQERAIPLILDGKDVLARGRTGSGEYFPYVWMNMYLNSNRNACQLWWSDTWVWLI